MNIIRRKLRTLLSPRPPQTLDLHPHLRHHIAHKPRLRLMRNRGLLADPPRRPLNLPHHILKLEHPGILDRRPRLAEEALCDFPVPLQRADAKVDDVRVHDCERVLDVGDGVELVGEEGDFGEGVADGGEGVADFTREFLVVECYLSMLARISLEDVSTHCEQKSNGAPDQSRILWMT